MKVYIGIFFFLVLPGIFGIFYGFWLLSGRGNKSLYMTDHIYTGRVYIGIPLGLAALFFAGAAPFEPTNVIGWIFLSIGGSLIVLALIFAFIQPSFLKPAWLKWLEREHADIMQFLVKDANKMGLNVWNKRIQTQTDLEEWVAEVRRKYKR